MRDMIGSIWAIPRSNRRFTAAHLGLALLVGAVIGGGGTFALRGGIPMAGAVGTGAEAAPPRATITADEVNTTATEQYAGWYLRPPIGAGAWAAETEQYTDKWYKRATDLAGSTTATEQYYSYYIGDRSDD
ncbi:MAG TPA: hypothetical protein VF364_10700 [Candidatus Limnocylindria bacterium]